MDKTDVQIADTAAQLIAMNLYIHDICRKKSGEFTDDDGDRLWNAFIKQHEIIEIGWVNTMISLFGEQMERQVARIMSKPAETAAYKKDLSAAEIDNIVDGWMLDFEQEVASFGKRGRPQESRGVQRGGMIGMAEVGVLDPFDMTLASVQNFIDEKTFQFSYEVNSTTQVRLRTLLKESVEAGDGARETAQKVRELFNRWQGVDVGTSRSVLISRTETTGAVNFGIQEGYRQSNVVTTNIWVAARDERTRPDHIAVDGREVKIGERFPIVNLEYPGDPSGDISQIANCRCVLRAGTQTRTPGEEDE